MFAAFKNYWNAVAATILVDIIVVIGLILLIVPGIIFACKLAFVPYLVVDRKMGVMKAIDESWHMTNGHAGKVFLIGLLAFLVVFVIVGISFLVASGSLHIFIVLLIVPVICGIILFMWLMTAIASLYHAVSKQRESQLGPVTAPTQTIIPPGASPILPA